MVKQGAGVRARFTFLGWKDGWYVLRLSTRNQPPLAVQQFQADIVAWLIEQAIIPNELAYLANGNTGDGPAVPAAADGSTLCLLLRRAADVLRFERQFGCRGITADVMFEALRAEANVHRFVVADIVLIAYDATSRFAQVSGADLVNWEDMAEDDQQFFSQCIQEHLDHPDWSPKALHTAWVDRRRLEGWHYAPEASVNEKRHPWMVPFDKLTAENQTTIRLMVSIIGSLSSLIRP